ncbi:MAG: hypothetical protein QOG27_337 [Verrucomicrobiota bacterium]|jgi:hypothetical protein
MKRTPVASSPEDYVAGLDGWRRACVQHIRAGVRDAASSEEAIKWGHLVYFSNGPLLLIRAEEERVLFGFWRGQHLRKIEPRLKPGGKYEMATLELREGDTIDAKTIRELTRKAVTLNKKLGDPTLAAKRP